MNRHRRSLGALCGFRRAGAGTGGQSPRGRAGGRDADHGKETASTPARLLQEGKVRAIGVSNFDRDQTERFRQVVRVPTMQPPYNLFERDAERDLLPYAKETGLVMLAYGALCRGLLSGRMSEATAFDGDDLRRVDPKFQQPRFSQYLAAVAALDRYARENFGNSCSRCGGFSTRSRRSRFGAHAGRTSSMQWRRSRAGRSTRPRCGKSIVFSRRRLPIRSV